MEKELNTFFKKSKNHIITCSFDSFQTIFTSVETTFEEVIRTNILITPLEAIKILIIILQI